MFLIKSVCYNFNREYKSAEPEIQSNRAIKEGTRSNVTPQVTKKEK